jgi:hypothetical protein
MKTIPLSLEGCLEKNVPKPARPQDANQENQKPNLGKIIIYNPTKPRMFIKA